ncbi:hypothetical protein CC1G_04151 [Coprinopsis cinerea okayama7|uniref:Uncharacterized protein n=1 Tax=Coprinopsis cinerea (strain Okayama-7 / 130 / ATCC MYA-4618 / FGSC 9003) TaxID=240176 RepID=A8NW61_COPC7|nr:hypothetical protein CC1G_04151 [Coprinopsis cinerea okayama7\|eukprot:XP_001836838.1 hypothetical protein CC1G_04151 [Coprinopsis cinerea okayama7\
MPTIPKRLPAPLFRHIEPLEAAIALRVLLTQLRPNENSPELIEAKLTAIRDSAPDLDMRKAAAALFPGEIDEIASQLVTADNPEERARLEGIIESRVWFRRWMDAARIHRKTAPHSDPIAAQTVNRFATSKLKKIEEMLANVTKEDEALQAAKVTLETVIDLGEQS